MLSTPDYLESANRLFSKPLIPGLDSYLSNITNHGTALPLWSTKSMFDKEYLEVEVLAEAEVQMDKNTDDILNMNTYTCHICDTEVPKAYIKEHNHGEKHKTCMKITDLALERTRNHMKSDIKELRLSIQVTNTYFCEPCAMVIQNFDKMKHEVSERHVKSLRFNEILKEFLMIYEDKYAIDLVTKKSSSFMKECSDLNKDLSESDLIVPEKCTNISNNSLINETPEEDIHESQNELEIDENSVQKEHEIPKTIDTAFQDNLEALTDRLVERLTDCITKYTKAEKKENIHKANSQLINYLHKVTENCKTEPIHTIEAVTDKVILITAINGDKIKVSVNNFHSIHKQKDKSYCKVCENPNVGYNHESSEEHMDKIMTPIEDKNAIRKIDDIWSHCVLCNDLTKNTNFHLQSLLHRNKLKQCLVNSGTDINENIVQNSNPQKQDTSQLIQEHGLIISHNNAEITCHICDTVIPNKEISITNHIKTFDHITTYSATIERNKLTELDDLQYYCVPCDMCVAKCYALGHCNGKKHTKHLAEIIKNDCIETDEEFTQIVLPSISQQIRRTKKVQNADSELVCFVCNIVLYNVDKHTNSLDHKKNYLTYLEANKLNEIEEDTFYCIPCNTVILIDYLMNHCTSKKHKTLLKNFISNAGNQDYRETPKGQPIAENSHISRSITQSVQNTQTASTSTPPAVSQNGIFDTAIPMKFLYQFREMSNSKNLLCTICDEEVPYRKFDVQSHVNIIDHIVAFNLMMLWNKIKRLNDKYFCDVCKVDITYFNEISHVMSGQHVAVMTKQPKGTVYEYDRTLLTLEYAMSHKVGDRVRPSSLISTVNKKKILKPRRKLPAV